MSRHLDPERARCLDDLAPEARAEALAHAARCAPCRTLLAQDGPERLFCLLAVEPVPPEALDRLSAAVSAAVAAEEPARPRRGFAAASIAASLLLAVLLGTYLFDSGVEAPAAPATPVEGAPPLAVSERAAGFELVTPEEAEVVRVQIGDTQLVMVFDEALSL